MYVLASLHTCTHTHTQRSPQHVLVLSSLDVDALCACKILQSLFKADDVQHTLVPVAGKSDLQSAFADHADQVWARGVSEPELVIHVAAQIVNS